MEKIRKAMEESKQKGEFNKNTDIIVHLDEEISQPIDVLEKLLGVNSITQSDKFYIEILQGSGCKRCGKKSKENFSDYVCNRCNFIYKNQSVDKN